MEYDFDEIFNIPELYRLCENFTQINGTVTALLDLQGKVYISTGWQDLCTRFHRKHPESGEYCTESDTVLAGRAGTESRYNIYKCRNGLMDVAIPIFIRNEHVGNFFTGQFLLEPPDFDYFRNQARHFEFDEDEYLEALSRIPVFSENEIKKSAMFLATLTEQIGEMGLKEIQIRENSKKLEDEKRKYKNLFDEATDSIILLDRDGIIFDANKSSCSLFRLSKKDLIGKNIVDVSFEKQYSGEYSSEKVAGLIEAALNDQPQHFEWLHCDSRGKSIDTSVSLNKLELSGTTFMQAIIRDISVQKKLASELDRYRKNLEMLVQHRTEELKKAQIKLIQADKMASLGILTAGVAHEINNPLNFLMGAHMGLKDYFSSKSDMLSDSPQSHLTSLEIGIERISNIIKSLNQFSRSNETLDETCDVNSIIDNCLVVLHNKLKSRVTILKEYTKNLKVQGNVGKLHQVFINLISNAAQAIPDKGDIKILTRSERNNVLIEIIDTGTGIEEENLPQITVPFFTTKPPGAGTGLGLSITYNIIKEHGGLLEFDSETGKGTRVTIILPSSAEET